MLAAGRGRRMGAATADRPKAGLLLDNRALLDWQIASLRSAGLNDIAVVTGHARQALAGRNVTYLHNPVWGEGTQAASLFCARAWAGGEDVVVAYGDIVFAPSAVCAVAARPGDIVIGYDGDHRWLWKRRFGNWLADSESFSLGPGQRLLDIGAKPRAIDDLDGQFMGLWKMSAAGFARLGAAWAALSPERQAKTDITALLAVLIEAGTPIDTAATLEPWMEIDRRKDLALAHKMAQGDWVRDQKPALTFHSPRKAPEPPPPALDRPAPDADILAYAVTGLVAVQNWGRSGSTFVQSLLDDHPQLIATPNFYARAYYEIWAKKLCALAAPARVEAFLTAFQQWWDPAYVDAAANVHRLGPERDRIATVDRAVLERYLHAWARARPLDRRGLFVAAHLAYALARGQRLAERDLRIVFPVHGEPRGVAAQMLEDFADVKFIHTVRAPGANLRATARSLRVNGLDARGAAGAGAAAILLHRASGRSGRAVTTFAERPYFRWLAAADRARLLQLEDLHAAPEATMRGLANWLGITWDPCLLDSTWNGLLWWNRAESAASDGAASGFDAHRSAIGGGGALDQLLATLGENIGYPRPARATPAWRIPWLAFVASREIGRGDAPSRLRVLQALTVARRFWPRPLTRRVRSALARERQRAAHQIPAGAARRVRAGRPEAAKAKPVHALLVLASTEPGAAAKVFDGLPGLEATPTDRVAVLFADEVRDPPKPSLLLEAMIAATGALIQAADGFRLWRRLIRTAPAGVRLNAIEPAPAPARAALDA